MSSEEVPHLFPPAPTEIPKLSLEDLMNETSVTIQKEANDRLLINSISQQSIENIKTSLLQWVIAGCNDAYPIQDIPIQVPDICSDGVKRNIYDYIQFVTGKVIEDHIQELQNKLSGIRVSFVDIRGVISIIVFKV